MRGARRITTLCPELLSYQAILHTSVVGTDTDFNTLTEKTIESHKSSQQVNLGHKFNQVT